MVGGLYGKYYDREETMVVVLEGVKWSKESNGVKSMVVGSMREEVDRLESF